MYKTIFLALLSIVLCACAPTTGKKIQTNLNAEELFAQYAQPQPNQPYAANLSLRIGRKGDTRRITALLWGNDASTIRLDIQAGVGATLAKIFVDPNHFLLLDPLHNKAYTHQGSEQPRLKIGIPLPLTLANMADLINGRFVHVFGHDHNPGVATVDGVRYALKGRFTGEIELDNNARLIRWQENKNGHGWDLRLEYEAAKTPAKITLKNHRGEFAIIAVKEHSRVEPYSKEALTLTIPASYTSLPLAQYTAQK